jgi:tetratricopeptide (TPR) repeat protein
MKKLFLIVLLAPAVVLAQKAPKPNTGKILSLYQEGNFKEAKQQADITIADPKLAVDGKAWYYRGLIYATLDTTQDAAFKDLDPNARKVAIESFRKSEELNKKGTEYFITVPGTVEPIMKKNQLENWANYYLAKSIKLMQQEEPDYEGSYAQGVLARSIFETTLVADGSKYRNDTLAYYVQALAAINVPRYDSAEEAALKYVATGGKSPDVYLILFQIYNDKGDKVKALAIAKEAREKYPFREDFAKNELNVYLSTKQYDAAKSMVEEQIIASPSAENYYLLGELNRELKNIPEAMKAYKKALELDVNHFDSNASMAELTYAEVGEVRKLRDASKDNAKRQQLYMKIEQELKKSLPYWERLEAIKPNDENVLYGLSSIYNDLSTYDEAKYTPKLSKLKAKMKGLGLEVD